MFASIRNVDESSNIRIVNPQKGKWKQDPGPTQATARTVKKTMQCRFTLGTQQVCTCITLFHTFYRYHYFLYSYHTKLPKLFHVLHFCVCMNDTTQKFCFCFSDLSIHLQSLRFQREKSLPTFSKLHKVMTFETVQIYFLSHCRSGCLFPRSHKKFWCSQVLILNVYLTIF